LSQYYYALSTLPALSLEQDIFPSPEKFLEICADWLSQKDLRLVHLSTLSPDTNGADEENVSNDVLVRWRTFESELRNEMAKLRGTRLKRDTTTFLRTDESGVAFQGFGVVAELVRSAVGEPSPYLGEKILNQLRWSFLDELLVGHIFDAQALQVYYLKLQILARNSYFNLELGEKQFQKQYQSLSAKISAADQPQN